MHALRFGSATLGSHSSQTLGSNILKNGCPLYETYHKKCKNPLWVFNVLSPLIKARPIKAKPGICRTDNDRVVSYPTPSPGRWLCLNNSRHLLHTLKGSKEGFGSVAVQLRGRRGMGGERAKKKGCVGGWVGEGG
jgi:hypothetical protein